MTKSCIVLILGFLFSVVNGVDYVQDYFDQKVDHFNFVNHGNKTFKQRYLYNDTWWERSAGPIFFYAGNEGNVLSFWDNTGFIFRAAAQFKAVVVFAEHRYYGESLPFGNDSFTQDNIGLLSIEQALADYAFFVTSIKQKWKVEKHPVVAFGGSYGGILAAYMRFKYPNVVIGSIAASAPLPQIAGLTSGDLFFQAVTKDFRAVSQECENRVRAAYAQLQDWAAQGSLGLKKVSDVFHLCQPLRTSADFEHFLLWSRNAFVSAAMVDYPYPASFMGNFPAYPVNVMCKLLTSSALPEVGLFLANALFYNASDPSLCFDIYAQYVHCADPTGCGLGFDSQAWDYQACTQMNLECSTNGVSDMFPVITFNSSIRDSYCLKKWNVLPRRNFLNVVYWGSDISSASNIVFSNGNLDPWAQGGFLHDVSDTLVTVIVDGGAHHLDLREDNPADPLSVRKARNFELKNIAKWLNDYYQKPEVMAYISGQRHFV